jgi:hypothetical protein
VRQHDRYTLRVYECPAQRGFWHLCHIPRPVACSPGGRLPSFLNSPHCKPHDGDWSAIPIHVALGAKESSHKRGMGDLNLNSLRESWFKLSWSSRSRLVASPANECCASEDNLPISYNEIVDAISGRNALA